MASTMLTDGTGLIKLAFRQQQFDSQSDKYRPCKTVYPALDMRRTVQPLPQCSRSQCDSAKNQNGRKNENKPEYQHLHRQ